MKPFLPAVTALLLAFACIAADAKAFEPERELTLNKSFATGDSIDLGLLTNIYICHSSPFNLQSYFVSVSAGWPDAAWTGTWLDPDGTALATAAGNVNPLVNPEGIYQYAFTNSAGDAVTVSVNVAYSELPPSESRHIIVDLDGPPFNPFDSLSGFDKLVPAGMWFMVNLQGSFVTAWNEPQPLINPGDYQNLSVNDTPLPCGLLMYVYGNPPCEPRIDTLFVSVVQPDDNDVSKMLCTDAGPVSLQSLLPASPIPGNSWFDAQGEPVSNIFDPSEVAGGSTINLTYKHGPDGDECFASYELELNVVSLDIDEQPVNQNGEVDGFVQFVASASNPDAEYQWQGDVGSGWQDLTNFGQYSGVNTPVLTVSNLAMLNNNELYRCVIDLGPCTETTVEAVLTVNQSLNVRNVESDMAKLYPNPVYNELVVEFKSMSPGTQYTLSDALGKTLLRGQINQSLFVLDMAHLQGGLYLLTIEAEAVQTFKIIKR